MNLKDELLKLIELQKIDAQIYTLRQDKDINKPQKLSAHNAELAEKKAALKSAEDAAKAALLKKKENELELAAKEEGVKKAQAALYQLKSNNDYQLKLNEIASLKADISIYEENVLKSMDAIEKYDAELKVAKEKYVSQEKIINESINAVTREIDGIAAQIKALEDKRQIIKTGVDHIILSKYERLLEKRAGIALAVINNNTCSSCHMQVNHQKVNEIKMYTDLVLCGSCNRILYMPEDFTRD